MRPPRSPVRRSARLARTRAHRYRIEARRSIRPACRPSVDRARAIGLPQGSDGNYRTVVIEGGRDGTRSHCLPECWKRTLRFASSGCTVAESHDDRARRSWHDQQSDCEPFGCHWSVREGVDGRASPGVDDHTEGVAKPLRRRSSRTKRGTPSAANEAANAIGIGMMHGSRWPTPATSARGFGPWMTRTQETCRIPSRSATAGARLASRRLTGQRPRPARAR